MELTGPGQLEGMIRSAFSDIEHPIEDLVGVGVDVAVRLRSEGIHRGDFVGVPASGKHLSVEGAAFLRVVGSLDQPGLMRQLRDAPHQGETG